MIHPLVGGAALLAHNLSAERNHFIDEIKKDVTIFRDIPSYLKDDPLVVKLLHEIASDKIEIINMGYDVLKKHFFANEIFYYADRDGTDQKYFFPFSTVDFDSFYNYVGGEHL